jgi:hypothetical protein
MNGKVIDEEEMIRRRNLIDLANAKNIGNPYESEMCERFIMNFSHPVFCFLLKYKYEYCEGKSHHGCGDIVFSSKKKVHNTIKSEVLIIEAKYLDLRSTGPNQCVKRTKHRKKGIEQLNESMKQWKLKNQKDNIYGSILINERRGIAIYDLTNKKIIIGYLYLAEEWYHLDSFNFIQDEIFNFDIRKLLNTDIGDDEDNETEDFDENQNSYERDTFDRIEIDKEEMNIRRNLIASANKKNIGKTIEKESNLCERFIMNFNHPVFRYLLKYEYEYYEGFSDKGSGDIVFSSEKKEEKLSLTRKVLIIEAKYLDHLSSGRNHCGKRTKHRKKVIEQVNTSMKHWKLNYECDDIYGSILINESYASGIKNILVPEIYGASKSEKIYLSYAKICKFFDSIDSIEYDGKFNFDLVNMMTSSHDSQEEDQCRYNFKSYLSDDEDNNNESENSVLSENEDFFLPCESEDDLKEMLDLFQNNSIKPTPFHLSAQRHPRPLIPTGINTMSWW